MATKDYKDPRWQAKRLRVMERDKFSCRSCGDASKTLHVHHRSYEKGGRIWDTKDSDLVTLCEECHDSVEEMIKSLRMIGDSIAFLEFNGICEFKLIQLISSIVEKSSKNTKWGSAVFGLIRATTMEIIAMEPLFECDSK